MHGGNIYSEKIKHDFSVNLNPFCPRWKTLKTWISSFKTLKIYPELESVEIRNEISKKYHVEPSEILVGNGASELLLATVRAMNPKKAVLISPCFSGYIHALNSVDSKISFFPLDEENDFSVTSVKVLELINFLKEEKPEMLFLCNPNNPNGKLCDRKNIIEILNEAKTTGTTVLLDECFIELTEKGKETSFAENIGEFENLIVLNAFTKTFGIPGLRLGFCFCSSNMTISKIRKQLPEWNVSSPAQRIGSALLKSTTKPSKAAEKISIERNYLEKKLTESGFKVFPSDSNFILFKSEFETKLKEKLLGNRILIRDCSDYQGLKKGFYRIAVKTHKENKKLLSSIRKVIKDR